MFVPFTHRPPHTFNCAITPLHSRPGWINFSIKMHITGNIYRVHKSSLLHLCKCALYNGLYCPLCCCSCYMPETVEIHTVQAIDAFYTNKILSLVSLDSQFGFGLLSVVVVYSVLYLHLEPQVPQKLPFLFVLI